MHVSASLLRVCHPPPSSLPVGLMRAQMADGLERCDQPGH